MRDVFCACVDSGSMYLELDMHLNDMDKFVQRLIEQRPIPLRLHDFQQGKELRAYRS